MIILDTNVISELMRSTGAPVVSRWAAQQLPAELWTTAINEAEIFYGIELIAKGKRREQIQSDAEGMFGEDLLNHVLMFDSQAARAYARIIARRRALGRPIGHADAQIAAIAQVHGAVVATRDIADFTHCGIRVVNPWES